MQNKMRILSTLLFIFAMDVLGQQSPTKEIQAPVSIKQFVINCLTGTGKGLLSSFEKKKIKLGFDSTTTISDVTVGEPIRTNYITADSIKIADESRPVSKFITQTGGGWLVHCFRMVKLYAFIMLQQITMAK